jgi:predicted RNA-binding Zn-ribbon protein involved in translation (DUF1610 family)
MRVRCLVCGREVAVGVFWSHFRCPDCGVIHNRLGYQPRWVLAADPEVWLCFVCGAQFEVWETLHSAAPCPGCGGLNVRECSHVIPVRQPVMVRR